MWESSALPEAEFTGERVIPGHVDADLLNEHLSRYAFARRFAEGRRVLDLGCGAGYGSALLAEVAEQVTGLDASSDAVDYAREHYNRANLSFEQGDASASIAGRFDLITAFEVIEHLENWRGLLNAAQAALTPNGLFFVSTPNKPLYAEARGESGGNPFHVHEFEYGEYRQVLEAVFPHVQMLVQNHSSGILFSPVSETANVQSSLAKTAANVNEANFFVAVCSLQPLPPLDHFFWIPSSANLLRERDRHIALLLSEMELKAQWEQKTRGELTQRNREYGELLNLYRGLQGELEARNQWALQQDELLRQRGERITALQAEAEAAHADYARMAAGYEEQVAAISQAHREATEWGLETERRLSAELEQRGAMLAKCVELLHAAEQTVEERTQWAQNLDQEVAAWRDRFESVRRLRWVRMGTRLHLMADMR